MKLRKSDQASFLSPVVPIRDEHGTMIGSLWFEEGEWHSEHDHTGVTWASSSKQDAISIVKSQHSAYLRGKKSA